MLSSPPNSGLFGGANKNTKRGREKEFSSELIKAGIDPARAARVAKLLTNALASNSLAPEDHHLIQEVCSQWLSQQR